MRFNQLIGTALAFLNLFHVCLAQGTSSTTAINGVQGNGVQVRMELRTMQQEFPDMFNVYLLGLRSFMDVDQSDPRSYYQIAAIHGRPYIPWDGVGTAPGFGGGYCTHTSNLFCTWHRPYLALFEQTLYEHVQAAAQSFPEGAIRDRYAAAAVNFRPPYWDWAMDPCPTCQAYPVLVSQEYVLLDTPTGEQWMLNPLFRYDFHPVSVADFSFAPFAQWNTTKRYPTSWSPSAQSQDNLVAGQIASNQVSMRDRLYNLMTSYSNFPQFSNEAWFTSTTTNADSLESLHDVIHAITGNNGHMTYLDFSAFDPVFWLHHTMIDRCFAIWQALYPDSYVEPLAALGSTFTYPAGYVNDVNSPLPPFHSDTQGTNWTSADVVDTARFGYTYPELSNGASQGSVRAAVNALYGNTAGSSTVSVMKKKTKRSIIDDIEAAAGVQSAASGNDSSYEYIANVVSQKFAMGSSYGVYMFLGNYSDNSLDWGTDPNLVGVHGVFANMASDATSAKLKARGMDNLKGTGSIPLTTALINKVASGELASLRPSDVESYLTGNLDWRAAYYDGAEIPIESVIDLSISVVEASVEPAASETDFPVWGAYVALVNITADKPGGHNKALWKCPEDGRPYGQGYEGSSNGA